jgi:ComEC/Rec2-related protein
LRSGLALWSWLALRVRLPLVAAGVGAAAAVFYTLLTGAEVPTVRTCIGAVLVLAALALGREPLSLRMVAVAAFFVLLFWPEAVAGPSFQMSSAAVVAIVALHGAAPVRAFLAPRDEAWAVRMIRRLTMLLATGVVIELAIMPIGLFHFHRAGVYGALANVIAIPLTTAVTMPLIAIALALDLVGAGAPAWWLCGKSIDLMLALAHWVAGQPASVTTLPAMGRASMMLFVAGGLWLALWRGRVRLWGLAPVLAATASLALLHAPDILVSEDGHHVGIAGEGNELLVLRDERSDFARDNLTELAGMDGEVRQLADGPSARCSRDFCAVQLQRGGRAWHLLIGRGRDMVPERELAAVCDRADIVISDRWLPRSCRPAMLKADRRLLSRTGDLAIDLAARRVATVAQTRASTAGGNGRKAERPAPIQLERRIQSQLPASPRRQDPDDGAPRFNSSADEVKLSRPLPAQARRRNRGASVVPPQQPCKLALHLDLTVPVDLRFVGCVRGIEPDHALLVSQVLERSFFAADERDDDFAVARGASAADQREVSVEDAGLDHRIARDLERVVFAGPEESRGDGQGRLAFERFDRHAGGDATVQRNLDDIVRRLRPGRRGRLERGQRGIAVGSGANRGLRIGHVLRLAQHFEGAGAVGQATDEAALLECRDQPVDARFRLEVKRFLHLLKRWRYAGFLKPGLNEADQLVLLARQHPALSPSRRRYWRKFRERMRNN